jgi:hypothetical protein
MAPSTARRHSPRKIRSAARRPPTSVDVEALCESVAEVAVAVGEHGRRAYDAMALHPEAARVSPGDMVREAILAAGRGVAQFEVADRTLWERHDWRNTCDALAEAICSGVRRFDVAAFLR